ncbi:hypothetical protein GONAM_16_01150 [Gordonia namibiensis NBRC 108229]|uniref:Uncharacterized protein n=1 Tax=Gordonia namibiensis NBRC 108229 TaxID=1208314 RepID=K6XP42_9ACTN|nr:hypothetical protein [Gordonia namibiensis]GAC00615.1 hypothetical protein GONAM_16_01150 [Gordonia namibiensis NBRC 108229]
MNSAPRHIADELAPGVWPGADPTSLREAARRARALAESVERVTDVVVSATAAYSSPAGGGAAVEGEFADALVDGLGRVTGIGPQSLPHVAERLRAMAASLDTYADVVVETEQQMTTIALVADRDRQRAEVFAEVGDDSWRVSAASAGRLALTAAGDDYTQRSEDAGQSAGGTPPAATSGMMPFAPMGAMGAAGAAAAGFGAAVGAASRTDRDTTGGDLTWLRRRADAVQSTVPTTIAGWFRTAVGVGVGARGRRVVVVGTNDPQPYQRAGLELADDEALTANGRAPELAIVEHMTSSGITPTAVAAATPMDSATVAALQAAGVVAMAPGSSR